jgi:hypothetical protein
VLEKPVPGTAVPGTENPRIPFLVINLQGLRLMTAID